MIPVRPRRSSAPGSAVEIAVEKKEPKVLKEMISNRYADDEGNPKKQIAGLIALHHLRNEDIHLFTRIRSVEFPEPDRASVQVFVAMAARPIRDASDLSCLQADLYRFDLLFAFEGGAWRVIRAVWRPTGLGDFL
jgi:hypothetical protein